MLSISRGIVDWYYVVLSFMLNIDIISRLRQLSGGNSVGTPPPSPAPGFGKYKLADYR
jgi:hypothetical protein